MIVDNKPIIVAISGGADSVALLHVLHNLGYPCIAAHCNFHLRGLESDEDEWFVEKVAQKLSVPYYKVDFDTYQYAADNKLSIEMAARELRYNWFEELRLQTDSQAVAVAHHADDSVETLLMNLVRGTGIEGLTGIPVKNGHIVRPLLGVSRKEIEHYLAENNLTYRIDSTNLSSDYKRNKFRNEVIPLLEEINPSVKDTLYIASQHFRGVKSIYKRSVTNIVDNIVSRKDDIIKIKIDELLKNDFYENVLFEILYPLNFTTPTIKLITDNINVETGSVFYSKTHQLLRDREELIISSINKKDDAVYLISGKEKQLKFPIELNFKKVPKSPDFKIIPSPERIYVDYDKITYPLELRHWQKGDTFQPFGMKGKKKLSDFFVNNKLSRLEKDQCWVLLSGHKIMWVVGYRMDDRFKIDDSTRDVLIIELPEN